MELRTDKGHLRATPFYRAAWSVLKRDMLLVIWKLAADFARLIMSFALAMTIFVLATNLFFEGLADVGAQGFLLRPIFHELGRPATALGSVGIVACIWFTTLMIEAMATSGLWTVLARGARERPIRPLNTFFAGAFANFPKVLGLRVLSGMGQILLFLVSALVVTSLIRSTTGSGALALASALPKSLVWAVGLTLLMGFGAIVRLTFEVASAPLFVEHKPLGVSILDAAAAVAKKFGDMYRVFIFAGALLLVPLMVYWGVLMLQNLTLGQPGMGGVTAMMRLAAELFLYLCTAIIWIHFYGALFFYWSYDRGFIDGLPGGRDESDESKLPTGHTASSDTTPTPELESTARHTSLDDLLPDDNPNIVDIDEVTGDDE